MTHVAVPIALLGGTYNERVEIAKEFARLLSEYQHQGEAIVSLLDAPPRVFHQNEWVYNDIAQRVVMFHERQQYMELSNKLAAGEFEHAYIISVECAYELIADAMMTNNRLSAQISGSMLLGADGQPLSQDAIVVNQLAGSIFYSRGLVPYLYGAHGEFFSGGVWLLGTEEPDAAVVERLVSQDESGKAMTQKVPQGSDTQIRRFMEKAVLDGMEVSYEELPVGIEGAAARLMAACVNSLEEQDEGSVVIREV